MRVRCPHCKAMHDVSHRDVIAAAAKLAAHSRARHPQKPPTPGPRANPADTGNVLAPPAEHGGAVARRLGGRQ